LIRVTDWDSLDVWSKRILAILFYLFTTASRCFCHRFTGNQLAGLIMSPRYDCTIVRRVGDDQLKETIDLEKWE
jgi:hypothetical protein